MQLPSDPFEDVTLERLRRRGGTKWSSYDDDVVPAWVADSAAPLCPAVRAALDAVLDAGDLGYPARDLPDRVAAAFADRMASRFGWSVDPERVRVVTDVVQAFSWLIDQHTEIGDGVVLQTPVYPPFIEVVESLGRRVVHHQLAVDDDARWRFDPSTLDASIDDTTKVVVLVNPQNPTGRCFDEDELRALGDVAVARDLVVISDEIHAELTHDGHRHLPFASVDPTYAERTVTITSASKAFNLAGLRCAVVHFGSAALLDRFDQIPVHQLGEVSTFGMVGAITAWCDGGPWLDDLRRALTARRDRVGAFLAEHLPEVRWSPPEATYLAWLDMSAFGLGDDPAAFFETHARVALAHGPDFGPPGRGFIRLNFATSMPVLDEILERMVTALDLR